LSVEKAMNNFYQGISLLHKSIDYSLWQWLSLWSYKNLELFKIRVGILCNASCHRSIWTCIKTSDSCVLECILLTSITQNYLHQDITTKRSTSEYSCMLYYKLFQSLEMGNAKYSREWICNKLLFLPVLVGKFWFSFLKT